MPLLLCCSFRCSLPAAELGLNVWSSIHTQGVPQVWQEEWDQGTHWPSGAADELVALPKVIRPTTDDLRTYMKKREPVRQTSTISTMRAMIKFRLQPQAEVGDSAGRGPNQSSDAAGAGAQGGSLIDHEALKALATETNVIRLINGATSTLDLSSCGIDELKEQWFEVNRDVARTLKSADLGFNHFQWFPLQLLRFSQCLSSLCLDGNQLSELPPHIGILQRTATTTRPLRAALSALSFLTAQQNWSS